MPLAAPVFVNPPKEVNVHKVVVKIQVPKAELGGSDTFLAADLLRQLATLP